MIVAASVVLGAAGAYFYVWREISQPEVQLAYRLAKYLDGAVNDNQRSLILAKPIPEAAKQRYLERVRQSDGEEAMRKAQIEIQGLELGEVIIRGCCFTRTSAVIGYLRRPLRAPSGLLCGVIIRRPSANSPEDNQSRCCVADLCRSQFWSVSAQESKAGFPPKHRPP